MKRPIRKILITGIPCADWDPDTKQSFAHSFKQNLERQKPGLEVDIINIRDSIYKFASEERIPISPRAIHRASDEKIRLLRRLAFFDLDRKLASNSSNGKVSVIVTRATSYSGFSKEESLSSAYLKPLDLDLLVVVIDDLVAILRRLPLRAETEKYADLNIGDLVRWVENEVAKMEELAHEYGIPLFVIPRNQVNAVIELVLTEKTPAYLSYAMTNASEETKAQKDKLLEKLKEQFIVFDPYCMGSAHDESLLTDDEQGYNRDGVKKRDEQWFISLNSQNVVVYLPKWEPAHGSQTELDRASEQGKVVWVVLEPEYSGIKGRVSPFIERPADMTFVSSDELTYYLDLTLGEKKVYSLVASTMWGFKRRGRLVPLNQKGAAHDGVEGDVLRTFRQEVQMKYDSRAARGAVPTLAEGKLAWLIQQSWGFSKPVWQNTSSEMENLILFPQELPIAARQTAQPGLQEDTLTQFSPAFVPQQEDEQVFRQELGKYAKGENEKKNFQRLRTFWQKENLGRFQNSLDFLRFLKRTLDSHGYKPSHVLQDQHLSSWYKEYEAKLSVGSKH